MVRPVARTRGASLMLWLLIVWAPIGGLHWKEGFKIQRQISITKRQTVCTESLVTLMETFRCKKSRWTVSFHILWPICDPRKIFCQRENPSTKKCSKCMFIIVAMQSENWSPYDIEQIKKKRGNTYQSLCWTRQKDGQDIIKTPAHLHFLFIWSTQLSFAAF